MSNRRSEHAVSGNSALLYVLKRTLNRSQQWRYMLGNRNEGMMQRLAQFAVEHQLELVVE